MQPQKSGAASCSVMESVGIFKVRELVYTNARDAIQRPKPTNQTKKQQCKLSDCGGGPGATPDAMACRTQQTVKKTNP